MLTLNGGGGLGRFCCNLTALRQMQNVKTKMKHSSQSSGKELVLLSKICNNKSQYKPRIESK